MTCVAPAGGFGLEGVNLDREAVIVGHVLRDDDSPAKGYARLLDASGEFTAEVALDSSGAFTFFAAPGRWTVRAIVPGGTVDVDVETDFGSIAEATVRV